MVKLLAIQHTFAHFAHRVLARLAVGAVQYQDAVEVVYFMLKDTSEEALGLDAHGLARGVLTRDRHECRALHLDPGLRDREASLYVLLRRFGAYLYHRVHDRVLLVFVEGDKDALEAAYLIGCEPHPLGLAHHPHHLLRQVLERLIEVLYRARPRLQDWVPERSDLVCDFLHSLNLLRVHVYASLEFASVAVLRGQSTNERRCLRQSDALATPQEYPPGGPPPVSDNGYRVKHLDPATESRPQS